MKRGLIIGFIAGVIFAISSSTFAEGTLENWIGKTVEGQFPVSVDGVQLATPAAVIDGRTFLPVREFGEAVGYDVYFDAVGEVYMEKMEPIKTEPVTEPITVEDLPEDTVDVAELEAKIQRFEKSIDHYQTFIDRNNMLINGLKEEIAEIRSSENITPDQQTEIDKRQRAIDLRLQQNEKYQAIIADLEQKKSELETELAQGTQTD